METHKSEVHEVKNSPTVSNASLVQSMLQRLRKDESFQSLNLSSLGGSSAEENGLSGPDNDQEASSRKFNTQVPAEKLGNSKNSPTVFPKWERQQLFLRPVPLDTFGGFKQESEDEHHPPGERDEHFCGCKIKTRFQAPVTVSETQERMSAHKIQMMPLNENSSHNNDNINYSNTSQIKDNSGTGESVARENTETEIYEDVLPLSSMDKSLSKSTEMQPYPSPVQTHNTISNTSRYRVRKVKLSSDFQTQTKCCVVTSTKTRSGDQPLKTPINENTIDSGMDSDEMQRRCSTHTTVEDPSLKRGVTGSTGSNISLGKVSDKRKNTIDITEKLKKMWREKGESTQDKESLYLEPDPQSVEETMISPTTFYEEQEPSEAKTCLQRTFTLHDFKLDLGSMNLMDEVFLGDEWSKYLPVQKCPSQEQDTDHSQTSSVHACNDNEMSMTANLEHHGSRPEGYSGSVYSENTDLQRMVREGDQVDSGVESSTYIYAIQMEDVVNPAEKNTNPSGYQEESEDIYDYVEYMIPMLSNRENSKSTHFLDFSVIKSQELLDNSMLKSRISLGKKRKHWPPGRREKAEKSNSTFYNIPSSVLQQPPQLLPAHSPSASPQPAVFSSSVFYARPSLTDSQTLLQSLGSVTEKTKPKWKGLFPKMKGKSKH